jgi:hypothetical protein
MGKFISMLKAIILFLTINYTFKRSGHFHKRSYKEGTLGNDYIMTSFLKLGKRRQTNVGLVRRFWMVNELS